MPTDFTVFTMIAGVTPGHLIDDSGTKWDWGITYKVTQDQLLAAQSDTSLVMLQEQNNSASSYLARLTLQQADLRMESQMLELVAADRSAGSAGTDPAPGGGFDSSTVVPARSADYLSAAAQKGDL